MNLKIVFILCMCANQLWASAATEPAVAGAGHAGAGGASASSSTASDAYLDEVKRLSFAIKTTEDPRTVEGLTNDLKGLLEKADARHTHDPVYQQAAYALFLNGAATAAATTDTLRAAQTLATPVKITDDMYYVAFPTNDRFVMLERLTNENWDVWYEYATKQINYARGLPSNTGLLFFQQRIDKLPKHGEYDMWIAYLSHTPPSVIAEKRKPGVAIDPNDLDMVMSVQMKEGIDIYSPMGISRTVEAHKKIYEDEKAGKPRQRLHPSESIWLHTLTARIVKDLYPRVTSFWTHPVPAMAAILANALYPQHRIISPTGADKAAARYLGHPLIKPGEILLSDFLAGSHSKVQVTGKPYAPWAEEHEFSADSNLDKETKPIEIPITGLLRAVF